MPTDRQGPHPPHDIGGPCEEKERGLLEVVSCTASTSRQQQRRASLKLSTAVSVLLLLVAFGLKSGQGWTAPGSSTLLSRVGWRRGGAMALRWRCAGSAWAARRHLNGALTPRSLSSAWWGSATIHTTANSGGYYCLSAGGGGSGGASTTVFSQPSMAISTSASASAAAKKKVKVAAAGAKKTKTTAAAAAGRTAPSAKTTTAARKPSTAKKNAPKKKRQPVASAGAAKKSKPAAAKREGSKKVLVIVESPAKARTITELLKKAAASGGGGELYKGYTVDACNGHVTDLVGKRRDVPAELKEQTKGWDVVGVDVENDFEPLYIQNPKKKAIITRLKKASAKCDEIILATDEDREGEAISWHLLQVLEPKVPVKRAVFHEITQEALVKAFEEPGQIDENLVQAQEARRILDRLAGFTLTPVIWNFVAPGLSAGRVQSVALAMVVERERARLKFKSADYWDVVANVTAAGEPGRSFEARLVEVGSKTVVTGKDFDPDTGEIKDKLDASKLELLGSEKASAVAASLSSLEVLKVDKRRVRRQPPAPFITSTLQQESSRKLRLGVDQTMRAAQALYEAGYITYMRTDRPSLSKEAAGVAEGAVRDSFGDEYVRKGDAKVVKVKGSQEAHEAIRPALVGAAPAATDTLDRKQAGEGEEEAGSGAGSASTTAAGGRFLHPTEIPVEGDGGRGLEEQHRALYDLVYRRTLASAMAESEADFTTVSLGAGGVSLGDGEEVVDVVLKASGKTTVFEGFLKAYREEGADESVPGGAAAEGDDQETELPLLVEGGKVVCEAARPAPHRTSPPRRFSEASFIKELEAKGVGRPSTYASIIGTLRTRTYVNLQGRSLTPSLTGFVVADLLREHFPDFTDTGFTAKMEDKLDAIARGEKERVEYLSEYYLGEDGLKAKVASKTATIDPLEAKRARLPGLESLDDRCSILVGPYGGYLIPEASSGAVTGDDAGGNEVQGAEGPRGGEEEEGEKKSSAVTLPYVAQDNLELLTVDLVERCLDSTYGGGDLLGQHPDTGEDIRIRMGRYGPFLECGGIQAAASAHVSTANKKDPTDLSLPSQPTPTELLQQRGKGGGQELGASSPDGETAGRGPHPPAAAAAAAAAAASGNDTVVYSAEDVIAFGLGANATEDGGGGGAAGDGGGDGGVGTWYSAVSLERAVGLLSLPRVVCESHPTEGGAIEAGVGRFGVWIRHKDSYKNVPAGIDVLDVDEALAVRLVDEMIQRNKDRPTIEIGMLDGEKVFIKYAKYGRCISCDGTVVMLPPQYRKTKSNPEPEEISLDEAIALVLEKRSKDGPAAAKARARARARGKKVSKGGTAASTASASGTGKRKKKGVRVAKGKNLGGGEKRPLSGFFRFCKESRELHTAATATAGTEAVGVNLNAETLSARWKGLGDEERGRFNAAAAAALEQWKADNAKAESGRSSGSSSGGGKGSGKNRVPQPKNAYILFSSERRPGLKEEVGGEGLTAVEMTKKLAQEWRELEGSSVREEYARRAALLKEAWLKDKEEAASAERVAPAWVGGGVGGGKKLAATK